MLICICSISHSTGSSNAPPVGQPSKKSPRSPYSQPQVVLPQIPSGTPMNNATTTAGPSAAGQGPPNVTMEDESSSESDRKDDASKVS